jgi:hypothetical protein
VAFLPLKFFQKAKINKWQVISTIRLKIKMVKSYSFAQIKGSKNHTWQTRLPHFSNLILEKKEANLLYTDHLKPGGMCRQRQCTPT